MESVHKVEMQKPKSQTLDDERPRPDSPDQATFQHHLARYQFALGQLVGDERILDAGCGTGYGSSLLGQKASSVVGVDYSPLAVGYATERYAGPGVSFAAMDCQHLGFPSARFDAVVCFEVFEHMVNPEAFLNEIVRVLAPGGRLILSTPNRVTADLHMRSIGQRNEFHVNMMDAPGLRKVLSRHFGRIELYGQRRRGNRLYAALRALDIWNLRLRLLPNRRREQIQRAFDVPVGEAAVAEAWVFTRSQIRQSNQLVAVCSKKSGVRRPEKGNGSKSLR
jgi:SAM-dependent methyltransferase